VSIPTLAATQSTGGTAVSGTVAAKVSISATPSSVDLGALPKTVANAVTVNVKCNKAWELSGSANKMTDGTNTLTNGLEARKNGTTTWKDLSTALATDALGTGGKTSADGTDTYIDLQQQVADYVDAASDDYGTTITFTVTY